LYGCCDLQSKPASNSSRSVAASATIGDNVEASCGRWHCQQQQQQAVSRRLGFPCGHLAAAHSSSSSSMSGGAWRRPSRLLLNSTAAKTGGACRGLPLMTSSAAAVPRLALSLRSGLCF
jgi:hypothetical protein